MDRTQEDRGLTRLSINLKYSIIDSFLVLQYNNRVADVVEWLFSPANGELNRVYNLLMDNCQHFAERAFNYIALAKKYPSSAKTQDIIYESLKQKLTKTE